MSEVTEREREALSALAGSAIVLFRSFLALRAFGPMRARQLAELTGVSETSMNRHLDVMREVGFVAVEKVGKTHQSWIWSAAPEGVRVGQIEADTYRDAAMAWLRGDLQEAALSLPPGWLSRSETETAVAWLRAVGSGYAAKRGTIFALADSVGYVLDPEDRFETQFVTTLVQLLHRDFRRMREAGVSPESLGDPEQLAERVAAAAPLEPAPLEELVGPFYDTAGLRNWLDMSRQALADRVKAHTVLGLQTGDGRWVYPAWQFTKHRKTIPHFAEVLRALAAGTDERWTWALWLTAPNEDWDEMPAWKWLAEGHDPAPVLAEAQADATRWAA